MNLVTLHHVGVAYDGYEALKMSTSRSHRMISWE